MCLALAVPVATAAKSPVMDTRILIDISGSMKKNDPDNQRRSALRLLAELLPEGSKAGVWTFGQYVNMQVKHGLVNNAWKRTARAGATSIHSRGMFTNIESALRTAGAGLREPKQPTDRHLILLTDGMVDISKNAKENDASRARIQTKLVPWLQERSIKVHTVALSARADHELLSRLARSTGGRYIDTKLADDLKRIFFRLFEAAVAPDTVPLKENEFQVDEQIKEMTVLVFHPPDAPETRLVGPRGKTFDKKNAPAKDVSWVAEKDFDLITLREPDAGQWKILAATDPDNRVMVVSDLTLEVKPLPVYSLPGKRPLIDAELHFQETLKGAGDLFELVSVQVTHTPPGGVSPNNQALSAAAKSQTPKAGVRHFSGKLDLALQEGEHELTIRVDGKSFSRQKRLLTHASWPARLTVNRDSKATPDVPTSVTVTADAAWIRTDDMHISPYLVAPDGSRESVEFSSKTAGSGSIKLPKLTQAGEYRLEVELAATTHDGTALSMPLSPLLLSGAQPKPEPPPVAPTIATETVDPVEPPSDTESADINWLRTGLIVGAINLAVALFGIAAWYWRKRRAAGDLSDISLGEVS